MNIYLVTDPEWHGYDVYESFVCIAASEQAAANLHPSGYSRAVYNENKDCWEHKGQYGPAQNLTSWEATPSTVSVVYIGKAKPEITSPTVILASFNAG